MNKLPPSIRENQRYLRFKIHSEKEAEIGEVVDAIWDSAISFLGSKEASRANLWIIGNRFDRERQEGVLRVNSSMEDDFRVALTLLESIGSENAFVEVTDVSGTIDSLDQES